MLKEFILALGLLLGTGTLFAQVKFTASTDAKSVVLDGYFEVKFILVNAKGADFKAPSFNGFEVLSGPDASYKSNISGGKYATTTIYNYVLRPVKVGRIPIGAATVAAEGNTYRSQPFTVEVVYGKPKSEEQRSTDDIEARLRAEIANTDKSYFVGQQISLDYRIYTNFNIDSYNILKESEYQGFFTQDVRRINFGTVKEVLGGIQYTTKVLKRLALYPQQAGTITVEPLEMQIGIVKGRLRDPRTFFPKLDKRLLEIASPPLEVTVIPLPPDSPFSFTGAVGEYDFEAEVIGKEITTDDAVKIRLTIRGDGDVKRVQAPDIALENSFETYAPKIIEERSQEKDGRIISYKIYEYVAIPLAAGTFNLDFEFSFFDPNAKTYKTLTSDVFPVLVSQGSGKPRTDIATPSTTEQTALLPILPETTFQPASSSFFNSSLFWVLFGMPILALVGAFAYSQSIKQKAVIDPIVAQKQKASDVAQKHLAQAQQYLSNAAPRAFYNEISKAMLGYVNDKLQIPNSELTKHNVRERLSDLSISSQLSDRFLQIIQTAEVALFARKDKATDLLTVFEDAKAIIVEMEEQLSS